jgi:DNA polymerase III epsilon subunit family exonuclease
VISPGVTAQALGGYGGEPQSRLQLIGPEPDRARVNKARLLGSPELGQAEQDPLEQGRTELGTPELSTPELSTPELGPPKPGPPELGTRKLGPPRLGRADLAGTGLSDAELGELEFAVVDLETTGWSPLEAAITEIGAVRVRGGQRRGEFASLVNPGTPVPPKIADLTRISDLMLAPAPRLGAVLPGLLDFARGCVLVAHNAPFDLGFLTAACGSCGLPWPGFTVLDTVTLARQVMSPDEVPDCKLGTLAGYFRARTAPSHRALADARATADVLGWLIRRLAHRGVHTLGQLEALGQLRAISQLAGQPDVVA